MLCYRHGAFSNRSIILHELKSPTSPGWAFARARGALPFQPTPRTCDSCAAMGWSTVPASPIGAWSCCGDRMPRGKVAQFCRKRARCENGVPRARDLEFQNSRIT